MDERIMDLVSLITDQVQTKQDLFSNEGKIMDSLMSSGYRLHEADAALTLLQTLARTGVNDSGDEGPADLPGGMRTMTARERARITVDAFGFLAKLAHLGIITGDQREDLLDKALSLHSGKIDLAQMRSLLAFDLFAEDREYGAVLSSVLNHQGLVWN